MKRPLLLAFSLALCIVLALIAIGAGELEVYNPRTIQRGNTALSVWSIPVAVAGNVVSNSICAESGTNWTLSGSLTSGPHTNATVAAYANYQSSATATNYYAGKVGIGTDTPSFSLDMKTNLPPSTPFGIRVLDTTGDKGIVMGVWRAPAGAYNLCGLWPSPVVISNINYIFACTGPSSDVYFNTPTASSMYFQVNGATKMTMKTTGEFGVNSTPLAKLDVNGGVNIGSVAFDPGANNLRVQGTSTFDGSVTNATSGGYANYQSSATGTNVFMGPVGIGTLTPFDKFHISLGTGKYAIFGSTYGTASGNYSGLALGYAEVGPLYLKSAIVQQQTGDAHARGKIHILNSNADGATNVTLNDARLTIIPSGSVGINAVSPLATLDINGGVNIGSAAYDPGANNLSVLGTISGGSIIRLTNSTDVAADPAATTGVQWQSTGGWEYRNSVASEGAGQINRVHNRAAQVVGVGTDYSLTQTKTNVTFGTSGGSIALPTAGTYQLQCLANFASTTAADDLEFYLWDSTNNVVVPGSWQHHESHANNDHDVTPLTAIYTVTTNVHIWLGAVNVTAARGVIVSTNTILTYVRCY